MLNMYELFESIGIIVDAKLKEMSLDRTIVATIVDDSNKMAGVYQVHYDNATFFANAADPALKVGDLVYVGIPEGDYTNAYIISKKVLSIKQSGEVSNPLQHFVKELELRPLISANGTSWEFISQQAYPLTWLNGKNFYRFSNHNSFKKLGISIKVKAACEKYVPGSYGIRLELKSKVLKNDQTIFFTNSLDLDIDKILGDKSCNTIGETIIEELFDIADIVNIEEIHAFLYCSKNLDIKDKIELTNIQVFLGGDQSDYTNEGLFIYCEDDITYDETSNFSHLIYAKWIYKENDIYHIITPFTNEQLPPNAKIIWYENGNELKHANDQLTILSKVLNIHKDSETYKVQIIYDSVGGQEPLKSTAELVFKNGINIEQRRILKPQSSAVALTAEKTDYKNIYNADGRIVDFALLKETNSKQLFFTASPLTNNFDFSQIRLQLDIKIPKINSNIVIETYTGFVKDISSHQDFIIFSKEITQYEDINELLPYSFQDYYIPTNTNNTIICELKAYDKNEFDTLLEVQAYELNIEFSRSGVCKTDYILQISLTDELGKRTSAIKAYNGHIYATAHLYNAKGEEIPILEKIQWSWYQRDDKKLENKLDLIPIGLNQCQIKSNLDGYMINHDYSYILMAQYNTYKENNIYTQVISYNPIAINLSAVQQGDGQYAYIADYLEGPSVVIYDSTGGNPEFYRTQYELFDQFNEQIEIKISTYINNEELKTLTGKYCQVDDKILHAPLVFSKGTETQTTLFIKDVYDTLLWIQPVVVYQTKSFSSVLNDWNGKSITIEDTGDKQHLLTPSIGTGRVNEQGQFSGVVLGTATNIIEDGSVPDQMTGIYGYCDNEQTYGLQENGTAFFGKNGGRIVVDGNSTVLYSDNFNAELVSYTDISMVAQDDSVTISDAYLYWGTEYDAQIIYDNEYQVSLQNTISPGLSSNHLPNMAKDDDNGVIILRTNLTNATSLIFDLDIIESLQKLAVSSVFAKAGLQSYSFLIYTNQEIRRYFFFCWGSFHESNPAVCIAYTYWSWNKDTEPRVDDNIKTRATQFKDHWNYCIWGTDGSELAFTQDFYTSLKNIEIAVKSSDADPCHITIQHYDGYLTSPHHFSSRNYIAFADQETPDDAMSVFNLFTDLEEECTWYWGGGNTAIDPNLLGISFVEIGNSNDMILSEGQSWIKHNDQIYFETSGSYGSVYDFTSQAFRIEDSAEKNYNFLLKNILYKHSNSSTIASILFNNFLQLNNNNTIVDLNKYRNPATQQLNLFQEPNQGGLIDLKTGAFIGSDFYMYDRAKSATENSNALDNSQILSSSYARQFYNNKLPKTDSDLLISCFREQYFSQTGEFSLELTNNDIVSVKNTALLYTTAKRPIFDGQIPENITTELAMRIKTGAAFFDACVTDITTASPFIDVSAGFNPFGWQHASAHIGNRQSFISATGYNEVDNSLFAIYISSENGLSYLTVEFFPWLLINSFINNKKMIATVSFNITIPEPYGTSIAIADIYMSTCSQHNGIVIFKEPVNMPPNSNGQDILYYENEAKKAMYNRFSETIDDILCSLSMVIHSINIPGGFPVQKGKVSFTPDNYYICSCECDTGGFIANNLITGKILSTNFLQSTLTKYLRYTFTGINADIFSTIQKLRDYWNNTLGTQNMFVLNNTPRCSLDLEWSGIYLDSPEQILDADNYFLLFKNGVVYNKNAFINTISSLPDDKGAYSSLEFKPEGVSLVQYQNNNKISEIALSNADKLTSNGKTGWVAETPDFSRMLYYKNGVLMGRCCYNVDDKSKSCYRQWCDDNNEQKYQVYNIYTPDNTPIAHMHSITAEYYDNKTSRSFRNDLL